MQTFALLNSNKVTPLFFFRTFQHFISFGVHIRVPDGGLNLASVVESPRTWESGHGGIAEAQDTSQPALTDLTPVIVAAWSVDEAAATAIQQYTCDTISLHLLVAIFIVVVIIVVVVALAAVVVVSVVVAVAL